ncbi:MAG: hypothetical protein ACRDRK_13315 [Pseudonocardia sp.]
MNTDVAAATAVEQRHPHRSTRPAFDGGLGRRTGKPPPIAGIGQTFTMNMRQPDLGTTG